MDKKTNLKSPIEDEPWAVELLNKLKFYLEDRDGKYLREVENDVPESLRI